MPINHNLTLRHGRALTGARIETNLAGQIASDRGSRALTGARIETTVISLRWKTSKRRALTGARIETGKGILVDGKRIVAPSRARGLKQDKGRLRHAVGGRALTGARIETGKPVCRRWTARVAPSRARGLKLEYVAGRAAVAQVAPSRARGLKRVVGGAACFSLPSRPHGRAD